MAFTTFSGPLRAGTVKDTTGTTAGTADNTGCVSLTQSVQVGFAAGTTTVAWLPAGSQITNINFDVTTAYVGSPALTIGNGTTANQFWTSTTLSAVGRLATTNAALANWYNVNASGSDFPVVVTLGAGGTAGAANVTVMYTQKNSDGSEIPASA